MKRKILAKRDYETEHGDFCLESKGVWPAKRYRYIAEVLGNSMRLPYKKRIVSEWHADKIQAIICATEFLAENHAEREAAWEEERRLDRELADAIKRGAEMFTAPKGYPRCGCDESSVSPAVIKSLKKKKEEPVQFKNGKIYRVKSPETGNVYPAFWSSDRERFIVLQLVAGGEVNTFELEKGCVVEEES